MRDGESGLSSHLADEDAAPAAESSGGVVRRELQPARRLPNPPEVTDLLGSAAPLADDRIGTSATASARTAAAARSPPNVVGEASDQDGSGGFLPCADRASAGIQRRRGRSALVGARGNEAVAWSSQRTSEDVEMEEALPVSQEQASTQPFEAPLGEIEDENEDEVDEEPDEDDAAPEVGPQVGVPRRRPGLQTFLFRLFRATLWNQPHEARPAPTLEARLQRGGPLLSPMQARKLLGSMSFYGCHHTRGGLS